MYIFRNGGAKTTFSNKLYSPNPTDSDPLTVKLAQFALLHSFVTQGQMLKIQSQK